MKAVNTANNNELADRLSVAGSLLSRMKGLLGRKELGRGEGLWIKPCKSVHTFGMGFPIDVVFLDKQLRVIAIAHSLRPNRLTHVYMEAASVLELPSGTAAHTTTRHGDRLVIS